MSRRTQNEKKFSQWLQLPEGGRRYWRDVVGRQGWRARYLKVRFWREGSVGSPR